MSRVLFKKKNRLVKFIKYLLDGIGWLFVYRSPKKKEIMDEQLWEIYRAKSSRELGKLAGCSYKNNKSFMIRKILNS